MPTAGPRDVVALLRSTDHLEIAANGDSAAARLDLGARAVHVAPPRDSIRRSYDDDQREGR